MPRPIRSRRSLRAVLNWPHAPASRVGNPSLRSDPALDFAEGWQAEGGFGVERKFPVRNRERNADGQSPLWRRRGDLSELGQL